MPIPLIIGGLTALASAPTVLNALGINSESIGESQKNAETRRQEFGISNNPISIKNLQNPNSLDSYDALQQLFTKENPQVQNKPIEAVQAVQPVQTSKSLENSSSFALPGYTFQLQPTLNNLSTLAPYIANVEGVAAKEEQPATPKPTVNPAKSQVPPASTGGAGVSGRYKGIKDRPGRGGTTTEGNKREPKEVPKNSYNTSNNSLTTNDYSWFDALLPLLAAGGLGYLLNRR